MTDQSSPQPAENTVCDGHTLYQLALAGCDWLDQHHAIVNQLNVFPVPDGDTGTNMLMTMRNAIKEASDNEHAHIGQVAAHLAHGAMMGSRGNSGTILSQLWQGFAHALKDQPTLTAELLVKGLRQASDTAYRGVIKPVEGTILTVSREVAEEAEEAYQDTDDVIDILACVVDRAKDALARTPEMLPILQKAGVVDSGGSGLTYILEGMLRFVRGEAVIAAETAAVPVEDLAAALAPEDEMGYGYDVQFIIQGDNLNVNVVRSAIDAMGWSTLVVGNESAVKVHVHVHDPGIPLSYGVSLGAISDIVVENMQEQFHEYLRERADQPAPDLIEASPFGIELAGDDIGVVAVVSGEGLARVFQQLGATELVMGGQTNNPSTQEILEAIQRLPVRNVILLPNNKNIILAAEQAARLATDQEVIVVPTRSMPQGISALLPYDPQGELDMVADAMMQAKDDVVTGEITTATRSVELNGVQVNQGQIIGLVDGVLATAGDNLNQVMQDVLAQMQALDCELITLYYGEDILKPDAEELAESLRQVYPDQEFELVYGGQPHYYFILSAE
ncbi:MAG: DAK2 domain-containing protein [Anaerolineae bacterium]|nr:DAK2 domain-containing protein [Anaerolineae bacterium]